MSSQPVHTVTQSTFEASVLERSFEVPVVVDFWAPWCGPCRMLGPLLERLAAKAAGTWELAKVDVDQNPELARRYHVQGIPAVKGFRDGQVMAEFVGAQPETAVRAFLQRLLPGDADRLLAEAEQRFERGDHAGAEQAFRQVLADRPDQPRALLGLACLLLARQEATEARRLLEQITPHTAEGRQAASLLGRLRFAQEAQALPGRPELERALAADEHDAAARWGLGVTAAAQGRYEEALAQFLQLAERNRRFGDDGGRKAMLAIFEILGPDDPLTHEYRRKLSAALY